MISKERGLKLAASALFALTVTLGQAQTVVNLFDDPSEVPYNPPAGWRFDFGGATGGVAWSPLDANGNANSGSMQVTMNFNSSLGGNNKAAFTTDRWYPGLDGSTYSSLQFDIRVDPDSAPDAFGLNGFFSMAIRNTDNYNYIGEFNDNIGVSWQTNMPNGWRHVSVPLTGPYDHIRALTFQLYGGPSQNIDGQVVLNIDNIVFVPEPSAIALLGLAGTAVAVLRRRK